MRKRDVAATGPQGIGRDVGDDDRLLPVEGCAAGAGARAGFNAIDSATVVLRKAGTGRAAHGDSVRIEKNDRAKKPGVLLFDFAAKRLERTSERVLANNHGQHLVVEQGKGVQRRSLR